MRGLIIRSQSGFYTVQTENGRLTCQLRGRMKKGPRLGDVAAIGDWVQATPLDKGRGAQLGKIRVDLFRLDIP
ncbi:MAG TPA: hypothetical protein VF498_02345, partial [Anaerolineales bacterium]